MATAPALRGRRMQSSIIAPWAGTSKKASAAARAAPASSIASDSQARGRATAPRDNDAHLARWRPAELPECACRNRPASALRRRLPSPTRSPPGPLPPFSLGFSPSAPTSKLGRGVRGVEACRGRVEATSRLASRPRRGHVEDSVEDSVEQVSRIASRLVSRDTGDPMCDQRRGVEARIEASSPVEAAVSRLCVEA